MITWKTKEMGGDGTGSGSCPVMGFEIDVKPLGYLTT